MDELRLERVQDPEVKGKQILKVSGGVTIGDAAGFREGLLEALEGVSELQVDLSEMTGIDLTGLQLLCAAHQSAVRAGKGLRIVNGENSIFRDTAEAAGFRRQNGCARDTSFSCIWVGGDN